MASSASSACRSAPSTRTLPALGFCNRINSRSSVDLPEPLPPISAKISARRTSKLMSLCTTWLPKRVCRFFTSITSSSAAAAGAAVAVAAITDPAR